MVDRCAYVSRWVILRVAHEELGKAHSWFRLQDCMSSAESFVFETPPLEKAGTWTVTAEYKERRPELARALSKKEAHLRSSAVVLEVREDMPKHD